MALGMRRPYTDRHSHSCIERGFRNRFNLDEALWSENALSTSRVAGHVDNAAAAESHTPPQTSCQELFQNKGHIGQNVLIMLLVCRMVIG